MDLQELQKLNEIKEEIATSIKNIPAINELIEALYCLEKIDNTLTKYFSENVYNYEEDQEYKSYIEAYKLIHYKSIEFVQNEIEQLIDLSITNQQQNVDKC